MNDQFSGAGDVQERLRFDVGLLEHYLREHLPPYSGTLGVKQFKGGQSNPTYLLTAGDQQYVLRRKPPGKLLPSAHAIDREYRLMAALAGSEVPVPRMLCLCDDDAVIGTPFYVMEFVSGRIFWDLSLPDMNRAERGAIFDEMNRVIAALHNVDYTARGLGDYGKPGNYFARQINRWTTQYRASETETIAAMDQLIAWLPANIPASERTSLVHGDYRLDNMVFHPSEPRVIALLDWELSTLGHPLADFAYHCMMWRVPHATDPRGLGGVDLSALGIPEVSDYLARYCDRTGQPSVGPAEWAFYTAYNLFRGAAISQGIAKRVLDGTAASAHAEEAGRSARPMAELAWAAVTEAN